MKTTNLEFINVAEDSYKLFEMMYANGMYDGDFDDFDAMDFFEGDPDMLKVQGETVYFAHYADIVWYYADSWNDDKVRGILRDFFASCKEVHAGYYHYLWPQKSFGDCPQNFAYFERAQNAIAYRGGCGYVYNIWPLAA